MVDWKKYNLSYEEICCNEPDLEYHLKLKKKKLKPGYQLLSKMLFCLSKRRNYTIATCDGLRKTHLSHSDMFLYPRHLTFTGSSQLCVLFKKMLDSEHIRKDTRNIVSLPLLKFSIKNGLASLT